MTNMADAVGRVHVRDPVNLRMVVPLSLRLLLLLLLLLGHLVPRITCPIRRRVIGVTRPLGRRVICPTHGLFRRIIRLVGGLAGRVQELASSRGSRSCQLGGLLTDRRFREISELIVQVVGALLHDALGLHRLGLLRVEHEHMGA